MKRILTLTVKRLSHSQRGQSIVLLAFACIALVAFVGLVTDVALLFVRYAALRRAVDAAAIAAAGQIRESTDYGEVSMAAEQYIELHNLDSQSILVETCETDIYQWRAGLGPWKGDPHPESSIPKVTNNTDHSLDMPETELCNWDDPHKLVRVSAQINSPTPFLSIIGIEGITLEATSVSETAVLDVALVIDTSESMAVQTQIGDYSAIRTSYTTPGGGGLNVRSECYTTEDDKNNGYEDMDRERWAWCCNDPGQGLVSDGTIRKATGGYLENGYIWHDVNGNGVWDGSGEDGILTTAHASGGTKTEIDKFNYNALICRPFKDVRDAARLFIKQLDFVRGDRVVLVTYDRNGVAYDPDGAATKFRPMIRSESVAVDTLNRKIGVWVNYDPAGRYDHCYALDASVTLWNEYMDDVNAGLPATPPELRPVAYETMASCGNTNTGGGLLAASNALTDPTDIRREAVWVIVLLTDGTANVTDKTHEAVNTTDYGYWGYCPWWTFCDLNESSPYHWPECTENDNQTEPLSPMCNDNEPDTRHFCIDWNTGEPEVGNPECSSTGHYDADDYARDMADFAGLIEVVPDGKKGNFIAMFSIGFGDKVVSEPTAAPLMRYIADAGDNGFIDNNLQQDWRDNHQLDFGDYTRYGDPDPCEKNPALYPTVNCGQYYYASDLAGLTKVFEDIASRMFTRLSR